MNRKINADVAKHVGTYSDAVEIVGPARLLYVSGTPGIDSDNGTLPAGFPEQAELAWQNIVKILDQADMRVSDIVKVTQHLIRREDLSSYREIRNRYLGNCAPASMLTFLPGLVWPEMLIELEVTAAK